MSTADVECPASEPSLCDFPEFALRSRVDDVDDPDEVTVSPAVVDEESLATAWLTVDVGVAVDIETVR